MAQNLDTVLTWDQAVADFTDNIMPYVREQYEQDGIADWPARWETWSNWTDSLCKDGQISDWQYENWSQPPICGA